MPWNWIISCGFIFLAACRHFAISYFQCSESQSTIDRISSTTLMLLHTFRHLKGCYKECSTPHLCSCMNRRTPALIKQTKSSLFRGWICHNQYAGPRVLLQSVPPSSIPLSPPHDSSAILLRLEAIIERPTNSFPILQRQPTLLELEAGPTGEQLSTVTRRDWKLSFKKREKQFVLALSPGNREKLGDCSKNTIWSPLWTNRSKAVGQL